MKIIKSKYPSNLKNMEDNPHSAVSNSQPRFNFYVKMKSTSISLV